ncbi:MAG TPA: UGSC family (seleno)protein [Candidatus Polarisedimenticolia bacterium]|nr:UGSC family (seleno)protein [Candidatus Polarisedimenticolia bacterium]
MPGVYFTTTEFLDDAKSAAKDRGMPGIRTLALPADKYYRARSSKEEAQPLATGCFNSMIDALTRPLTPEEAKPSPIQKQREDGTIPVTGKDFLEAFENMNELFLAKHWADGLPIVPPTRESVNAMLGGTTRSPQDVIGQVAPKNGTATVEKIAINAVMAGAKPEYFPVILAAMEGFTDIHYDLTHVQASTGSFTPVVIVDGPIAQELGFNSGIGMLGHGWRANSTVGRALRLSLLNIGQTWPQVNDMALTGRLEAYTFFTFAEDTERSPWEPYNVSRGFKPGDSTVTVASSSNPLTFGGGAVTPWTGQGVIASIIAQVKGRGVVWPHAQTYILVLHPDCAVDLANHGYTRRSLQEYLYEQTRVPYEKLAGPVLFGHDNEIDFVRASIADGRIRPDRAPIFLDALKPGGSVPVVQSPDDFHIVVAGGSPGYDLLFSYPGTNWANQTKKVTGATRTNAGRT